MTTVDVAPRPTVAARPFGRALAHTGVLTRRNLLANVRLRDVLLLSAIQPIIFMVMFLYVFGGAIETALPPAVGWREAEVYTWDSDAATVLKL